MNDHFPEQSQESSIKTLTITGNAGSPPSQLTGGKSSRRPASRRKRSEPEYDTQCNSLEEAVKIDQPKYTITKTDSAAQLAQPLHSPQPQQKVQLQPKVQPQPKVQLIQKLQTVSEPKTSTDLQGQAIPQAQAVILKQPVTTRVKLNPPSNAHSSKHHVKSSRAQVNTTRRVRRVQITNMNRKFTRANKMSQETKSKSVDEIRKFLIEKGVIQEKSKAPEKMLRSMYNDFALLKHNAL